jgi:hypothetical protein
LHSRSALTDAKFGKELRQYRLYRQRDSTLKVVDLFQFREENVKAGRGWALTVDITVRRCAAFTNVVADVKLRLHCRGSLLGLSRSGVFVGEVLRSRNGSKNKDESKQASGALWESRIRRS